VRARLKRPWAVCRFTTQVPRRADDFGYQYDQADRVTQETSTLGPTRNYGYDKAGEVTSDGSNNWTYDLTGNRTNTGYQTGAANQLVTDGTYNYTFDNEGNE